MAKTTKSEPFDKYKYYMASVQAPESDVEFFESTYRELKKKKPRTLREDFCGTFAVCCEWVRLNSQYESYGLDLDPEPLAYGKKHILSELNPEQQKRVHVYKRNVLKPEIENVDMVVAQNFSYFIFQKRNELLNYFKAVHSSLKKDGMFVLDIFGGSQCQEPNEEETEYDDYSYYWDQDYYDPVNNHAQFYIHFKRKGEKKRERVFSYDWRMWTIPEVRDILTDAGFKAVHTYWEGTDKDGSGDGNFKRVQKGEDCEAWVAYLAAEK